MVSLPEPGPAAPPFPEDLAARLRAVLASRGGPPRTRHVQPGGAPRFVNRLALQTSPYLLQHAHNPVDWRPWEKEAFELAAALDRPVFLSVGYSTCHWCHVMEEESFEDLEIARLLNEEFVCIKVDREERPDVDAIYMQAVQILTHRGGWPMSVFLTPAKKPFFAGTYFPPRDGERGAGIGFSSLLRELSRLFREERTRCDQGAEQIAKAVRDSLAPERPTGLPDRHTLQAATENAARLFDAGEGGVQRAPKFPSSLPVRALLRAWKREGDEQALEMAGLTLEKMALGGIYDQLGGGFHRYSTDARWLVPHFERMLYDNALLAVAYTEAWQATRGVQGRWAPRRALFARIAIEVLEYLAREMSDPGGGFWSAADADSEGEEGTFFVWTPHQITELLGPGDGARACSLFGVTEQGNFEGKNVLSLARIPAGEEAELFLRVRARLFAARERREKPHIDRKVLTSWNGLAVSAFARAGLAFDRPDFVERARKAAAFLLSVHRPGGRLLRASLAGVARHDGVLEDHAALAAACLDLVEATGEPSFLRAARDLHEELASRFADAAGGFFRTSADGEELLAREKPAYDGAEPTGNSLAALSLLRLEALTGDAAFRAQAEALLRSFGGILAAAPAALGEMLLAVDALVWGGKEVVVLRPRGGEDARLLAIVRERFLPGGVLLRAEAGEPASELSRLSPLLRERELIGGGATAYVCVRGACRLPTADPGELARQLDEGAAADPS